MAINKKLIHFNTLEKFKENLKLNEDGTIASDSNILGTSIVFIKDAKLIWTHGQYYGYDSISGDLKDRLDSINATIEENELITAKALTELNKTKADVSDTLKGYGITDAYTKEEIDSKVGSGSVYDTVLGDLAMPNSVGGISAGTTANNLKNKTFTQLFDDLLFPTINPEFTAPTSSISYSGSKTVEVGSTAPTADDFTGSLNRGKITVNGVEQAKRAGEETDESYVYHSSDTTGATFPETISVGSNSYYYKAFYSEGPQPKDNKGNDYGSPLEAGSVVSSAVTINGTYPWFASTDSVGIYIKQSLVAWNNTAGKMSTGSFDLVPQIKDCAETDRQTFILPREAKTIKSLNTLSGNWEDSSSKWTKVTMSNYYLGRTYYKYYLTSNGASGIHSVQATF